MGGEGGLGGEDGARPENGKFLIDDPQLRVGGFGLGHYRCDAAAVGAVVVEELDEGDVAVRIARHWACRVAEHLVGPCRQDRLERVGLGGALAGLQPPPRLQAELRVSEEAVPDAPPTTPRRFWVSGLWRHGG